MAPELTVKQAAAQLGLAERTIRRWCQTGKLRGRKADRGRNLVEWRVDAASVEAVRSTVLSGRRPRGPRGQDVAEEVRLLREQLAEYETVMGQLVGRIADLEATVQKALPPAPEEEQRPWWRFWGR